MSLLHLVTAHRFSPQEDDPEKISWLRFLVAGGLAVAFFFLIEPLGTFIAIPLYLVVAIAILSHLGWLTAIAISLGFSAITFVVFEILLEVPTPPGLLESLLNR